jgi:ligand-binding SRPBCC domain-containing protein
VKIHEIEREVVLPRPLADVFPFFADARNLERLTPPWLRFEVMTPGEIAMREGTRIDYRLRVHGIPIRWTSEITRWDPPHVFVDEQLRGPYRLWRHTHRFEETKGGTRAIDHVAYAVPGGALVHALVVKRDVEKIFDYRTERLAELFGSPLGSAERA